MTPGRPWRWGLLLVLAVAAGCPQRGGSSTAATPDDGVGDEDVMFPDERAREREADRVPPAGETVERGEQMLAQGEADPAIALFQQALEEDPRDVRARFDLGLAYEMKGEPEPAERAYRAALEVDESFPEALNNLGLLLRAQGRLDEAVPLLREAVQARPDFAEAQLNLALALEESGDRRAAIGAYRRAVQMSPEDPVPQANFGLLLIEVGRAEQAAIELRRALPKAKGNAAALQAIGNGLRRVGQLDQAVRAMRMAIEAHEGRPTPALLSELALAQRAAGDREGAEQTLERALELDPEYATAYYLLGGMRAGRGAFDAAVESFEKYLELAPNGPHAGKAREKLQAAREAM